MLSLFGQFHCYVSAVVLWVEIKAALTGNLLAQTVHFIRTVRHVVNIVRKVDYKRLISPFVSRRVEYL